MRKILVILLFMGSTALADIPKFKMIAPGIYRGGQPQSEMDYRRLARTYKIKTIINLRTTTTSIVQEKETAWGLGMQSLSVPINPVLGPTDVEVKQILESLTDASSFPIFIHCNHGKDRTGMIMALYRHLIEKWDSEKAFNEALSMGFNPFLFGLTWYYWSHAIDLD